MINIKKKLKELIEEYYHEKPKIVKEITIEKSEKNRGSFFVQLKQEKLKVILLEDDDELKNFLKLVPKIRYAPKIIFSKDRFVVVKWLEGKSIKGDNIKNNDLMKIAQLQAEIHKKRVNFNKNQVIESIKKGILKNIKYLEEKSIFNENEIKKIKIILIKNFPKNPKITLIHGDFNIDNLLKTKKGWFSIDNETVQIGFPGYDLGKPLNNICQNDSQRKIYLESYNKVSQINFYNSNKEFYQILFLIKQTVNRLKKKVPYDKNLKKIKEILIK